MDIKNYFDACEVLLISINVYHYLGNDKHLLI